MAEMIIKTCPKCGEELPTDAPGGLCPRCVAADFLTGEALFDDGSLDDDEPVRNMGEKVGPYELLEPLGEGGFGIVYRAEQTWPIRRMVALKWIKPGMDSKAVLARFEAERQAMGMMEHPHIARVLDAGMTDEGRPFFAMELVCGEPLTQACRRLELGLTARLELFLQLCGAVEHAHAKGVIHRDLKPSNVLVGERDGRLWVTIIDFGIAKALWSELTPHTLYTNPRQMLGTPEYMSPEQALSGGLDVDIRADIYSLGALLYELLTGVPPLMLKSEARGSLMAWQRLIQEKVPVVPSRQMSKAKQEGRHSIALNKRAGDELDWVAMKALEKDRERRYQTARELGEDVRRYLADETILAKPPSFRYLTGRFLRRHRLPVTAAVIVLTAIVVASIVSVVMAMKAERAELAVRRAFSLADSETSVNEGTDSYGMVIARLCRALRTDPQNEEARLKLLTLMAEAPVGVQDVQSMLHFDTVWKARFLPPDDRRVLTAASRSGALALWACEPGKAVRQHSFVLPGALNAFDVSLDGRWALSATATATGSVARVWSLEDKVPRTDLFRVVEGPAFVSEMVFSPDGATLYSAATNGELKAWEAATGRCQWEWKGSAALRAVAVSKDGRWVAAGHDDKKMSVHEAATGAPVWHEEVQRLPVRGVAFSHDNRFALATRGDTFVTRVEFAPDRDREPTGGRYEHHFRVNAFVEDATGERVATGGPDGWVRLRPAAGGFIDSIRVAESVQSLAFDPSGALLAVGTREPHPGVSLLHGHTGLSIRHPLTLARGVAEIDFSMDSKRLLAVTQSSDVMCFDIRSRTIQPLEWTAGPGLERAAFLPDGGVVAWMKEGRVRQWNAKGQEAESSLVIGRLLDWNVRAGVAVAVNAEGRAHMFDLFGWKVRGELVCPVAVKRGRLSANGNFVVLAAEDEVGWIGVFETSQGKSMGSLENGKGGLSDFIVTEDGSRVVTATAEGVLTFHELSRSGAATLQKKSPKVREPVKTLAISPDGSRVVSGSEMALLRVWDPLSGEQVPSASVRTPRHWDQSLRTGHKVMFSTDGSRFFSYNSRDLRLRCFYSHDGQISGPQMAFVQPVKMMAVTQDDRLLVAADSEGAVSLWHLGRQLQVSSSWPQSAPVVSLDFSPGGERVLAALEDGRIRVLPVPPLEGPPLPECFLRFAEGFGLWRLTAEGSAQIISHEVYQQARKDVLALPDEPENRQRAWIKWLASGPDERSQWPE